MQQRFFLLVVVGVAIIMAHAQAHIITKSAMRVPPVTSWANRVAPVRDSSGPDMPVEESNSSLDAAIETSASAVVDLRSLCTQLCGAGLCGAPCAGHWAWDATGISNSQNNIIVSTGSRNGIKAILPVDDAAAKERICHDLCALKMGGDHKDDASDSCGCNHDSIADGNTAYAPSTVIDLSPVCWTFCANSGVQLNGCRPCTDGPQMPAAKMTTAESRGGLLRSPRDKSGGRADDSTTTPDWNEVCDSLCKTGDGGSLCNCDLSPFKKKGRSLIINTASMKDLEGQADNVKTGVH